MKAGTSCVLVVLLVLALMGCEDPSFDELRVKLQQETDPGKRAKLAAQMGNHLLDQVSDHYRQGAYAQAGQKLEEYLDLVRTAHAELKESGRDARSDPEGFKELEIHLRRSERRLNDMQRLVSYDRRELLVTARAELTRHRTELLAALMGASVTERPAHLPEQETEKEP